MKNKIYKNKKNGKSYIVINNCLNATNAQDGQVMVVYKEPNNSKIYVREESEFYKKFDVFLNVCPFCGELPDMEQYANGVWVACCKYCDFSFEEDTMLELIEKWNRRI